MSFFLRYLFFSILFCILTCEGSRLFFEQSAQEKLEQTTEQYTFTYSVNAANSANSTNNPKTSHTDLLNSEQSEDEYTLAPLNSRTLANAFRHYKQQHPEYVLLVEFFPEDWSCALYKHLSDSGEKEPWHISAAFSSKRQRISGWKDANLLYNKGLIRAA